MILPNVRINIAMTYEDYLFKHLEKAADRMQNSNSDPKDVVSMDVPLFIRMLELAREDIKSDAELHHVVERVLALKNQGVLTMKDYDKIEKDSSAEEPSAEPNQDISELMRLAGIKQ